MYIKLGVGDMTKIVYDGMTYQILYHDNNMYHNIVIFFLEKVFYYTKIVDTI